MNSHPKTNRRERKKSEMKDRIVKSAVRLFLSKGFNETAVADIMADADLGTGTFYNYFQSKEELLKFCMLEKVSEVRQVVETLKVQNKPPSEKISEIVLTAGRVLFENRFLMGLYMQFRGSKPEDNGMPSHNNIFRDIISDVFRAGQEKGEFKADIPSETVAEMIFGILQTTLAGHHSEEAFFNNIRMKLRIFFEGIFAA